MLRTMFNKALIACQGEVAGRLARTFKRMGILTVAVHTEADQNAVHVQACDEAILLTGTSSNPYIDDEAILVAAKAAGADVIHAGYGKLALDASFVRKVKEAGIGWAGPTAENLDATAERAQVRRIAIQAEARMPRGSLDSAASLREAHEIADQVGYPVMLRPARFSPHSAMSFADDSDELEEAFEAAQRAAHETTGTNHVAIEHAIHKPRHVEVIIAGDGTGEFITLGEHEASARHHHRKLIVESPAPAIEGLNNGDYVREALNEVALRIARVLMLRGLGTVQFLLDADGIYHMTGIRLGLNPDHALHEMCTGLDHVELQLQIVSTEAIPPEALTASATGHAMEARLSWEKPTADGMNNIEHFRFPQIAAGRMRVETGYAQHMTVAPGEELAARITSFSGARHHSLLTLDRTIAETVVTPAPTNAALLRKICAHEAFRAGQYDVTFVERMQQMRI